jgi:hypothetical protein
VSCANGAERGGTHGVGAGAAACGGGGEGDTKREEGESVFDFVNKVYTQCVNNGLAE